MDHIFIINKKRIAWNKLTVYSLLKHAENRIYLCCFKETSLEFTANRRNIKFAVHMCFHIVICNNNLWHNGSTFLSHCGYHRCSIITQLSLYTLTLAQTYIISVFTWRFITSATRPIEWLWRGNRIGFVEVSWCLVPPFRLSVLICTSEVSISA